MDADAQYVFIYAKDADELVYFKYNHETKTLDKVDATDVDGYASGKLTLEATDVVWHDKNNDAILGTAKVETVTGTTINPHPDLDSIVVVKN